MNGFDVSEEGAIDRRPIITCAGELEVFSAIEDLLSQALPQDSCEWRRSLGRPIRSVYIGANFTPFSPNGLPKENQWDLIRQPLFHVYWTECSDVDVYKTTVKDDIESWLKEINARYIPDWLIVVVENYDSKRANKLLPRTTVLDKIRADFAPKQGDRCISVINPGRAETRSADSWRGLVGRLRHLLLVAYARAVMKLEDHVRLQREKRNTPGWNFMQYFYLQEELAQVLEMLRLYDEALVQYDELDALFSQFVVNGHVGDSASWLTQFQKPLERWHGLKLGSSKLRKDPSLLELRAYLFAKQAHMLLLTNKVWDMAGRCLPFLHACTREMILLDINAPAGAKSCWLFLASVEVLYACDRHNQADQVEAYSKNTACLWAYSSQKLRELGDLCGLLPGKTPTSEQLHIVVGLSAGMGDCPGTSGQPSPTDKLKKALSSQEAFNKSYLELAELAMGTYKHIGHLRSARLVGRDVASFYMLLGETQKSAAFLGDVLRTVEQNGWRELAAQTHIELAECYRKSNDTRKFICACAAVSAAPEIDNLIRWSYFEEMLKCIKNLDNHLVVPFEDIIKILSVSVKNSGDVMQDDSIEVELHVDSSFPREILCTNVIISLELENKEHKKCREKSVNNGHNVTSNNLKVPDVSLQRLSIQRHLDYKQDKQLSSASVVCKNPPLKRKNSAAMPQTINFEEFLETCNLPLVLTPGVNVIRLIKIASQIGKYYLGQVVVQINKLQLVSAALNPKLFVEIKREEPVLRLDKGSAALISGVEQVMQLSLVVGSYSIATNSSIKLTSSKGLTIQHLSNEPLTNNLEIPIQNSEAFAVTTIPLRVFADLPSKDHQVILSCACISKPIPVLLSFTPLFGISWRLHTVNHRKFIQITVTGETEHKLKLSKPHLDSRDKVKIVELKIENLLSQIITSGLSVSYAWELVISGTEFPPLKSKFSLNYMVVDKENECSEDGSRVYNYNFDIADYQTMYIVEAHVEPTKGNEFCRVGALCNLHLSIKQSGHSLSGSSIGNSLMYEVLAEQSVWAICGRTAGVVSFETNLEPQLVVLDVMPLNTGYLPLPSVRLSKYIPAESNSSDKPRKSAESHPRLAPFSSGQVYNVSKGQQVHVIPANVNEGHAT